MRILRFLRRTSATLILKAEHSTILPIKKSSHKMLHNSLQNKYIKLETHVHLTTNTQDSNSKFDKEEIDIETIQVEYYFGWPQIIVPLPSRDEKCKFILKPISNTVGDFVKMIKDEDRGVDRVICTTTDDIKIAACTSIQNLLAHDFKLVINDVEYLVHSQRSADVSDEDLKNLNHLSQLITTLYESLNVREFESLKEKQLVRQHQELKMQILPLEQQKKEFDERAKRETKIISWLALLYMSIQTGILARLTWWEYSWDIMEPVTYFVTYGTTMAAFSYFLLTKLKYTPDNAQDRVFLQSFYRNAKRKNFDVKQYNQLKDQIADVEMVLERLRDPVRFRVDTSMKRVENKEVKQEKEMDKKAEVEKSDKRIQCDGDKKEK